MQCQCQIIWLKFVHSADKVAEMWTKLHVIQAKLIMSVWCFTVHCRGLRWPCPRHHRPHARWLGYIVPGHTSTVGATLTRDYGLTSWTCKNCNKVKHIIYPIKTQFCAKPCHVWTGPESTFTFIFEVGDARALCTSAHTIPGQPAPTLSWAQLLNNCWFTTPNKCFDVGDGWGARCFVIIIILL